MGIATNPEPPQGAGQHENATSFRAVQDQAALSVSLGPLANLPGRWSGRGFNLVARPDFQGGNDIFLELNPTRETLDLNTIGSAIPNRGSLENDINLFGVHYLQTIADRSNDGALHLEPGIWISVPSTTHPPSGPTVTRLATIPHGDAVNMHGTASSINGPPTIDPANTVPFQIGTHEPAPGTANSFPEYNLSTPNAFRTNPVPDTIKQPLIDDPNSALRNAIAHQDIIHTEIMSVSTHPNGGVANIPFIAQNANAAFVKADFWIETVKPPSGPNHMQLQYSQTVLLNFDGLSWPHVTIATLTKTF